MLLSTKVAKAKAQAEGNVDVSKLKDIRKVKVDTSLPTEQRLENYIDQIKNPYVFKYGKQVIRIHFAGEESIDERIAHYISHL